MKKRNFGRLVRNARDFSWPAKLKTWCETNQGNGLCAAHSVRPAFCVLLGEGEFFVGWMGGMLGPRSNYSCFWAQTWKAWEYACFFFLYGHLLHGRMGNSNYLRPHGAKLLIIDYECWSRPTFGALSVCWLVTLRHYYSTLIHSNLKLIISRTLKGSGNWASEYWECSFGFLKGSVSSRQKVVCHGRIRHRMLSMKFR